MRGKIPTGRRKRGGCGLETRHNSTGGIVPGVCGIANDTDAAGWNLAVHLDTLCEPIQQEGHTVLFLRKSTDNHFLIVLTH